MAIRHANATWHGNLREGDGLMRLGSGAFEGAFTFASRFEEGEGTNPEELIGAANAGCFSMFLSAQLTGAGYQPARIHTEATVHLGQDDKGPVITLIELSTEAEVPDLDEPTFMEYAEKSKVGCPISRALAATNITLEARLVS